jgi:hypothetical protein
LGSRIQNFGVTQKYFLTYCVINTSNTWAQSLLLRQCQYTQLFVYKCTKRTHNGKVSLCPLTLQLILVRSVLHVFFDIYDVTVSLRAVFDTLPRPDATRSLEDDECPITHCTYTCRNAVIIHAELIYCPYWWTMLYSFVLACLGSICKFGIP